MLFSLIHLFFKILYLLIFLTVKVACSFLKILLIFRQRKRGKHQCVVASHVPPIEDLAPNPGMCPDWELNGRPFGLQASAQSAEPHQPGLIHLFFNRPLIGNIFFKMEYLNTFVYFAYNLDNLINKIII